MAKATLHKTCSSCGIQKPLSAFLQLSGNEGATYGSICASCRLTNKDKSSAPTELEESTRTTTTSTIDNKAKVQKEKDQKQLLQKDEEDYHAERDKDELIENERTEKIETVHKDQKKHRESFLGKRSFLTPPSKPITAATTPTERAAQQAAREAHNAEYAAKQETATKEEWGEKNIDLSAPVEDTRFGFKEKHKGIGLDELKKQAPLYVGRTFSYTKTETSKPESPSEFAERKWGPGTPRTK